MLCIKGCGFYGDEKKNGHCSLCYSKQSENSKQIEKVKLKKKCFICKKKVVMNGFICKCKNTFCSKHRYIFEHDCTFDHKTFIKNELEKNNPVIKKDQFEKI